MKQKALSNTYLTMFCMELSMLLQAGVTLEESILMLQTDETDKAGKAVLQSLLDNLAKGESFTGAFRCSGYFPDYMISMLEVGERTGRLTDTLDSLAAYYTRQERMTEVIKNAVLYPAILLVLMVAVVLILIIRVLPIFNDVFTSLGNQMSPLAIGLMNFGRWLGDVSAVVAVIVGLIIIIALAVWLVAPLRAAAVQALKNIFGGRGIWGRIASARFTSALALSSASGLDTEEAIEMASGVGGGAKAVDARNKKCLELLRSGSVLTEALLKAGILSARDAKMLSIGNHSGMKDKALSEIADRGDRNVQDEIDHLIGKIEPTLVIITSVIIGIILLSVMLPLMGIMSSIG